MLVRHVTIRLATQHNCEACLRNWWQQPDEPPLYPARLDAFDGNNLLKCVDSSGHADEHCITSSYLITTDDIEKFKDDVRLCPATRSATAHVEPEEPSLTSSLAIEALNDSSCTDNWKAANTITENTTKVFDQTGVFVSACRHGIVQTLVEMRQSGELYVQFFFKLSV